MLQKFALNGLFQIAALSKIKPATLCQVTLVEYRFSNSNTYLLCSTLHFPVAAQRLINQLGMYKPGPKHILEDCQMPVPLQKHKGNRLTRMGAGMSSWSETPARALPSPQI